MTPSSVSVLIVAGVLLLASSGTCQLQPDNCGRVFFAPDDKLPCCVGKDAIGEPCNILCNFGVCDAGIEGFCTAPGPGETVPDGFSTLCTGCGYLGEACCPDDVVGEIGSCASRATGNVLCIEKGGSKVCEIPNCGTQGEQCCSVGEECTDSGLDCISGQCKPPQAKKWEQCGGLNFNGGIPKECAFRLVCKESNAYYSQCVPDGSSSFGLPLYAQCGGKNYDGSTFCAEGECTVVNDWHSQCM